MLTMLERVKLNCYVYVKLKRIEVAHLQKIANQSMLNSAQVTEMVNITFSEGVKTRKTLVIS